MANKKGIKPKDSERIDVLTLKHPGDLTENEARELKRLEDRRAKYGMYQK